MVRDILYKREAFANKIMIPQMYQKCNMQVAHMHMGQIHLSILQT